MPSSERLTVRLHRFEVPWKHQNLETSAASAEQASRRLGGTVFRRFDCSQRGRRCFKVFGDAASGHTSARPPQGPSVSAGPTWHHTRGPPRPLCCSCRFAFGSCTAVLPLANRPRLWPLSPRPRSLPPALPTSTWPASSGERTGWTAGLMPFAYTAQSSGHQWRWEGHTALPLGTPQQAPPWLL